VELTGAARRRGGYPVITSAIIMSCGLTISSLPLTLAKS
jgi:hypothetical protein